MKIVVLDGYTENPGDLSWSELEKLGELTVYDRTPPEKIVERIGNAEVVIVNKTPISHDTLEKCQSICYIGVLATGYNVIDTVAAKNRGIPVCNIPTYGTASVAQFAIGLLLEICHHIGAHSDSVHRGEWENNVDWCYWNYPLIELDGKTLGVIGFGRIGQSTGKIAGALGMKVLAYDSYPNESGSKVGEYVNMERLLKESDVIALHCPLFPETENLINKNTIEKMKDGVIILNNSRGQLIVEQDLADALNSGKVYAAALDVVSSEPIQKNNPLLKAKNCIITPHISWAAKEPRERIMAMTVDNLKAFLDEKPVNVVNK
ncbi:MAG: D-2-hydroxyacid dehydrogenase [Oscillospiraceae bacterium]